MNGIGVKRIFIGMILPVILLILALGSITILMFRAQTQERMDYVRQQQETAIAEKLKGQVDMAITMVEQSYASFDQEAQSEASKSSVLEQIRQLRFGEGDLSYVWVHSFDENDPTSVTMQMHPLMPELNGTDLSNYLDLERFSTIYYNGRVYSIGDPEITDVPVTNLFVEMNVVCQAKGMGVVKYYWPRPTPDGPTLEGHHKMSYVELFKPWNWVIGTGEYIDHIDRVILEEQERSRKRETGIFFTFGLALAVALILGLIVSLWVSGLLSKAYARLSEQLRRNEEISGELSRRNAELESALQEVNILSGLLPICSYCKNIRDDNGYWNQMEAYISKRSEAQFSHGICPECVKKHFPDLELPSSD